MRKPGLAAAFMLFLAGFTVTPGDRPFWLAGHWVHETGDKGEWTEESWLSRGKMLVGVAISGSGEAVKSYEFMRIETGKDGSTTFWASPLGRTPVPFKMMSLGAAEVVFENPANDYPTRIVYRRAGDLLVATISGQGGANPRTWRYRRAGD